MQCASGGVGCILEHKCLLFTIGEKPKYMDLSMQAVKQAQRGQMSKFYTDSVEQH